ncbi:2-oxoglutarate dehydrogenase, partial [Vibrio parahaemolyticus]|nr:2-oxoglutarate dehydrogenase [Vibrio parahaemolyticus]
MKKTLLASLVCVVALAGCNQKEETVAPTQSQSEANPICSTENLAGGWSQGEVTPEAQQALD